jgi:hypothetical protein
MVTKTRKIPCNARIDIDYTEGKPKIKIGYTSKNPKKDAYDQNRIGIQFIIIFLIIFGIPFTLLDFIDFSASYPTSCNVTLNEYHSNWKTDVYKNINRNESNYTINNSYDSITGANFTCNNGNYSVYFKTDYLLEDLNNKGFYYKDYNNIDITLELLIIAFFIDLLVLTFFVNNLVTKILIKQKWYQKWLPKYMAGNKNRKKKYYKFNKEDVIDNVIIIPDFKNVELIYNTKGDFSKQLIKIKIREHRHREYKKQKVGKLKVNNYKWYALFFFKQKPKDGFLEVIYQ